MGRLRLGGGAGAGTLLKEVHVDVDVLWVDGLWLVGLLKEEVALDSVVEGDALGKNRRSVTDEDHPLVE